MAFVTGPGQDAARRGEDGRLIAAERTWISITIWRIRTNFPEDDVATSDRGTRDDHDRGLLIPAAEVTRLLDVSRRALWRLKASGRLPRPLRIGRSVRWRREEIRLWIAAGCPDPRRDDHPGPVGADIPDET